MANDRQGDELKWRLRHFIQAVTLNRPPKSEHGTEDEWRLKPDMKVMKSSQVVPSAY